MPLSPVFRFGQSPGARRRAGEQRSQHLIELVSLLASDVQATAPQAKNFEIVLRLLSSQRYGAFQQSLRACTLCCYVGTYFYLGYILYLDKLLKLFVWGLLG